MAAGSRKRYNRLIIEVLSRGTKERDRGVKAADYALHGVREYWIVDPKAKTVEQYELVKEEYSLRAAFNEREAIESLVISKLSFPAAAAFDNTAYRAARGQLGI